MKIVLAIIQPHKLDEVYAALSALGIGGLNVADVMGAGQQYVKSPDAQTAESLGALVPYIRIEIATEEALVSEIVETIRRVTETPEFGAGNIFVLDLGSAVRVRTNERGRSAL